MKGKVTPVTNLRSRLRKVRTEAKLKKWTQDVMRHSYASYWLAEHGDINRLTLNKSRLRECGSSWQSRKGA